MIQNYQRLSNRHYNGLSYDEFIGADGTFAFSKNIDVRRNPKGFQLVPAVNKINQSVKITAMLSVNSNFVFYFGKTGEIYMNGVLVHTLSSAVTNKEIVNAIVYHNYIYMFTRSGVHTISTQDATNGTRGTITENYIDYKVVGYVQPLDAGFTTVTLDKKDSSGIIQNPIVYDKNSNVVNATDYTISLLPTGFSRITNISATNGPFTIHYDYQLRPGSFIPVFNYYDATLYIGVANTVLGYHAQIAGIPDLGESIDFEENQIVRAISVHGTQISIYNNVDGQDSRQYFRSGQGGEPQAIIEWKGLVIQNIGTYGSYDRVVANDPRNEISYLYKTQGYERQLIKQGYKKRNNVTDGEFYCEAMNQDLTVKDELLYVGARQGIYTNGAYYSGFNPAFVRERQRTPSIKVHSTILHQSTLYIAYKNNTDGIEYVATIDLNYQQRPTGPAQKAFEPQGELITRVFTAEELSQEKAIKQIVIGYELDAIGGASGTPGTIEIWIKTDRRPRILIRTINEVDKLFCRIDPNEIRRIADGYIGFNILEMKVVLNRGSKDLTPVVYEINVLYEIQRHNNANG